MNPIKLDLLLLALFVEIEAKEQKKVPLRSGT
jgi:hypothetical protein